MSGECNVDFEGISGDADPVEFFDRREVKARKSHVCIECKGTIAVGERHSYIVYTFEGKFCSERICLGCHEVAAEFTFDIYGGTLWSHFADEWENGAHIQACLNRLSTVAAKRHMKRQWDAWHEHRRQRQAKAVQEMIAERKKAQ